MERLSRQRRKATSAKALPSREEILAFIADHPGRTNKRDIAQHFGLRGADKIGLKTLLKELEAEGIVEKRGRRFAQGGSLPSVTLLSIIGLDSEGDLIAVPDQWDEEAYGEAPRVLVPARSSRQSSARSSRQSSAQSSVLAPGLNDRVLARISRSPGRPEEPLGGLPGPEAIDDDVSASEPSDEPTPFSYRAEIIKVLGPRRSRVLGVLRFDGDRFYLAPIDRKQRELTLERESLKEAETGDLIAVEPLSSGRFGPTRARLIERIGSMNSEHAISTIALLDHQIPNVFPQNVIVEADQAVPAAYGERDDWRAIPFITIDPADAKDHDDAVFASADDNPDNPGGVIVLVAIADVAAYVTPGSALDGEAQKRGNSVYFPDRVVPMLPERISNNLCSLRAGEDRPALAVKMVFDREGTKVSHQFHRVLIRSEGQLSYQLAQAAMDEGGHGDVPEALYEAVLKPLYAAYACLSRGRAARQPLELDLPEKKIVLNDDGSVQSVFVPPRLDSHKLIEEFMIQANVSAAETLEKAQKPVVYRIHDAPSREKLASLKDFLATLNLTGPGVGAVKPARFNTLIAKVAGREHSELVNEVILRSQAQAEYGCDNIGHFGLNLRRYAHFTSPIRRYADLLVHRLLISALKLGDDGLPPAQERQLHQIAGDITVTERRAMAAERDTVDRLVSHFLADQVGARFKGKITGVVKSGLFVRLHESAADGYIPAATLGAEFFVFDEMKRSLIGERSGETYRLGDQVEVLLKEAEPLAGALRFEMITPGSKGKPPTRRRGGPSRRHRPTNPARRG